MDKADMYKIFAIGIVAVFVIEAFALGFMNNSSSNRATDPGTATLATLSGKAATNMTIVRYEPYLIIGGSSPEIDGIKKKLIDSGMATYEVQTAGNTILNLRSGKDAPSAAAELEKANATVLSSATIATAAKVRVEGDSISTTVDGARFKMQMRPEFEEGTVVPASFTADVQDGQIVSIGSFTFLPAIITGAQAAAILEGTNRTEYIEIAWENRTVAKQIAKSEGAVYREKSYISIDQGASAETLKSVLAQGKAFVTGVQPGVISVKNDFTGRQEAFALLLPLNLTPQFPPSVALPNGSSNASAEALLKKLAGAGISARAVESNTIKLKFPLSIEKDGKNYSSAGYGVELEADAPANATSVLLDVDFEASGSTITRFISIRQAVQSAAPPSSAGNNSTAAG